MFRCCDLNGTACYDKQYDSEICLQSSNPSDDNQLYLDFTQAYTLCEQNGYTLCTLEQLSELHLCGDTSCNNDYRQVWSSDDCLPYFKTVKQKAQDNNIKIFNGATKRAYSRCCSLDESVCETDINGVCPENTFAQSDFNIFEAVYICQEEHTNYPRLCNISSLLNYLC